MRGNLFAISESHVDGEENSQEIQITVQFKNVPPADMRRIYSAEGKAIEVRFLSRKRKPRK